MNYYRVVLVGVAALGIVGLLVLMLLDSTEPEQAIVDVPQLQTQERVVELPSVRPATEETPVSRLPEPELVPEPEPLPAPEIVEAPEPETEVEQTSPQLSPLPALNESDRFVQEQITVFENGTALLRRLVAQEVIRKFVMMTENVSRGIFPYRDLPVLGPEGDIRVRQTGEDDSYVMEAASYERFSPLVNALTAVDTEQAVNLYARLKPLFSQAYAELGLPGRDFDEVLLAAIDNVLGARTFQGPFELVRPNVMYRFADPRLENLNEVEKLLVRMGPENADQLKRKLMALKQALLATR